MTPSARRARDGVVTLAALAAVLAWDASGADLAVAAHYGRAGGFALRDAWWLARVLHDGGRLASGLALAATLAFAWSARRDGRAQRLAGWALVPLAMLAIGALKQHSTTSCPWALSAFGGVADYVRHGFGAPADGGPGRCFPSGHAAAAFAFWPLYFQWRDARPRLARTLLVGVALAGLAFGWAQVARGAHYPSHVLWTAWLCWALGAAYASMLSISRVRPSRAAPSATTPAPAVGGPRSACARRAT